MVRNLVFDAQPAEPPIRQIQLHFFAQPPLRSDSIAVTHDQHPNQKFWVDRRPSRVAIERLEMLAQTAEV